MGMHRKFISFDLAISYRIIKFLIDEWYINCGNLLGGPVYVTKFLEIRILWEVK
jgi:hypothetical protein